MHILLCEWFDDLLEFFCPPFHRLSFLSMGQILWREYVTKKWNLEKLSWYFVQLSWFKNIFKLKRKYFGIFKS